MASHPKLVRANILVPGNHMFFCVDEDNGGQLFHFEALGIDFADALLIHNDFVPVNAGRV